MSNFDLDTHTIYSGEALLLGWAETSTRGRTVTLELPNDIDTHPFRDLAIRSGKKSGQRMAVVFVQINDDETPVKQEKRMSQKAAILCSDEQFWHFASERSITTIASHDDARNWLLSGAGIKSRKEFDTNRSAADWLQHQVIAPFNAYLSSVAERVL